MQRTLTVETDDFGHPVAIENLGASCASSANSRYNYFQILWLLIDDLQGIDHACQNYDCSAMLVIMEHRDVEHFL